MERFHRRWLLAAAWLCGCASAPRYSAPQVGQSLRAVAAAQSREANRPVHLFAADRHRFALYGVDVDGGLDDSGASTVSLLYSRMTATSANSLPMPRSPIPRVSRNRTARWFSLSGCGRSRRARLIRLPGRRQSRENRRRRALPPRAGCDTAAHADRRDRGRAGRFRHRSGRCFRWHGLRNRVPRIDPRRGAAGGCLSGQRSVQPEGTGEHHADHGRAAVTQLMDNRPPLCSSSPHTRRSGTTSAGSGGGRCGSGSTVIALAGCVSAAPIPG